MRALNYPYPWESALIQRYCQHLFIIQLINSTLDGRDNWIRWYSEKFVTFFLQFEHMFKLNSPAGVIYYTVIVHANWAQHLQQRSSWGENTQKMSCALVLYWVYYYDDGRAVHTTSLVCSIWVQDCWCSFIPNNYWGLGIRDGKGFNPIPSRIK